MNIKIINDAKFATGTTVVIDVFRAFTVEPYLIKNGAKKVIPVGDIKIAYEYKEKDKDYILIGERNGSILPGFDYGNSPSQIEKIDFKGRTIIHTTSCGTQGIVKSINAKEVITGSLVNVTAIVKYIKQNNTKVVFLLALAKPGMKPFEEDLLCATYIKSLLENKPINNLNEKIKKLKETTAAKFFDKLKQKDFPQKDFYLCTEVDKFDFILRAEKNNEGKLYIKRIDV